LDVDKWIAEGEYDTYPDHRGRKSVSIELKYSLMARADYISALKRSLQSENNLRHISILKSKTLARDRQQLIARYLEYVFEMEKIHRDMIPVINLCPPESAYRTLYTK
jgi:hypothetical protein